MKIHLLSSFPGTNAGKTKDVDPRYHAEGIAAGWAVDAEDGSEHPEPAKGEPETEETTKPAKDMTTKTDADSAKQKTDGEEDDEQKAEVKENKMAAERKDKTDKSATNKETK